MIVEFHDKDGRSDDAAFREWREAHIDSGEEEDAGDGGFFLDFLKKSHACIHAAVCMHSSAGGMNWSGWLGTGTEPEPSLTKKRKVCADSGAELLAWANEHRIQVEFCAHCMDELPVSIEVEVPAKNIPSQEETSLNETALALTQENLRAVEGITREITITTRSRSEPLRRAALERARGICEACGRDYSKLAGGLGKRVLQVHHRRQLALGDEPVTNSLDELAVVCANCHLMIHADIAKAMSVEDLRRRLSEPDDAA